MLHYLLLAPIVTSILCFTGRRQKQIETINLLGSTATLLLGAVLLAAVFKNGIVVTWKNTLFADMFSAYLVFIISIVGFVASVYSVGYMRIEMTHGALDFKRLKLYYGMFQIFMFSMLLVGVTNILGLWIAIEMTTLVSAPLMIIYSKKSSVEAAWKYLIICTVGITFALFGTILTYYAAVQVLGEGGEALNWASLVAVADRFDPVLMKIAFIFILIGYGTKVGLAPMHTWLPDAHSEAPSPVSALLSGVLLNCAMYGIIRFHTITSRSAGPGFSGSLLILFGLLSVGVAVPFIILQKDYKRLLAYSSVEHMGIIAIGIGFGGFYGIFGALLHMFNHAMTKSLMFFGAGTVLLKYNTKLIENVSGMVRSMPVAGPLFVLGGLAITGTPPFSIFLSEFTVLVAGFSQGRIIPAVILLIFIIMIFAGLFNHISRMAFGIPKPGIIIGDVSGWAVVTMAVLTIIILVFGVYIPPQMYDMLVKAVETVR